MSTRTRVIGAGENFHLAVRINQGLAESLNKDSGCGYVPNVHSARNGDLNMALFELAVREVASATRAEEKSFMLLCPSERTFTLASFCAIVCTMTADLFRDEQ